MANSKISDLNPANLPLQDDDLIVVVQQDEFELQTVQSTIGDLKSAVVGDLEKDNPINLGNIAYRTNGYVYLVVPQSVYGNLNADFWAFSKIISIANVGTQDTSIEAGYEPLRIISEDETATSLIYFETDTTKAVCLKDIINRVVKYRVTKNQRSLSFGIDEKNNTSGIVPANAEVIENLSANYLINKDSSDNIKINNVTVANIEAVLDSAANMTEDKNVKLYLDANSNHSLLINNNGNNSSELEPGGYAELFFSITEGLWSVDVINEDVISANTMAYISYKGFSNNTDTTSWYKVGTATSMGTGWNKHTLNFEIFPEGADHGIVCGQFWANVYDGKNGINTGAFYCTLLETGFGTTFSPEDFCIEWNGAHIGTGQTATLWMKFNQQYQSFFIGIKAHSKNAKWEWAKNTWLGTTNEKVPSKPTGSSISHIVYDCEDRRSGGSSLVTSYGSMLAANIDIPIDIVTVDTYVKILGGTGGNITGGLSNAFTFQNNGELKCNIAGKYLVNWSLSGKINNNSNRFCEATVMINNTANVVGASYATLSPSGSARPAAMSGTAIYDLQVNDVVNLCIREKTYTDDINITHLTLTALKVG